MRFFRSLLLVLLCSFSVSCVENTENAPSIRVDGEIYKFGTVKEGENIVFTFFFFNTGKSLLKVKDIHVSCNCVHVREYDREVEPGERGKVYGMMSTAGFRGDVVKLIRLTTNIPGSGPVVLSLEGTIAPRPD